MITTAPTNYGLIPYGIASYAAYLSSFSVPATTTTTPVVETLITLVAPASVKLYFEIES